MNDLVIQQWDMKCMNIRCWYEYVLSRYGLTTEDKWGLRKVDWRMPPDAVIESSCPMCNKGMLALYRGRWNMGQVLLVSDEVAV